MEFSKIAKEHSVSKSLVDTCRRLAGSLALAFSTVCAHAQQTFDVVPLGPWAATGMNDAGDVVGYRIGPRGTPTPLLWSHGALIPMADLGFGATPTAINNSGSIAGTATLQGGVVHAVLWAPGAGRPLDLGTLSGANSYAVAINEAGTVVGAGTLADGRSHAIRWDSLTHESFDLGSHGELPSYSVGIDSSGSVVGACGSLACRWTADGVMADLALREHDISSAVIDTNDIGVALGTVVKQTRHKGDKTFHVTWTGDHYDYSPLDDFKPVMQPIAINNAGAIVGTVSRPKRYAFLLESGQVLNLRDLTGYPLTSAIAINNNGQILAGGKGRSYLLTPVLQR